MSGEEEKRTKIQNHNIRYVEFLLVDAVAALATILVLHQVERYFDARHREQLGHPTPLPTLVSPAEFVATPTVVLIDTTALPTLALTGTPPPEIDLSLWDCGIVNNPDQSFRYNANFPFAPTASHVLALPGIGRPGVDDPPYLLNGKLVEALSDLNHVVNGYQVCARKP